MTDVLILLSTFMAGAGFTVFVVSLLAMSGKADVYQEQALASAFLDGVAHERETRLAKRRKKREVA